MALMTPQNRNHFLRRAIRKALAIASLATLLLPIAADASGYVNNRVGWIGLTPEAQIGYVQGLNDSLNYTFIDDTLVNALTKRGRTNCLIEQKTNAAKLAQMITTSYRAEQNAAIAPSALYIINMSEICRSQINRERQNFGLGPI